MRLLLLIIAIWLAVMIVRHFWRAQRATRTPRSLPEQDMVRCAQCGLHLPKQDALEAQGRYYCSKQHLLNGSGGRR